MFPFKEAMDTFGNIFQRPVFSLGARRKTIILSQHIMYKIADPWTFWLNWSSNLQEKSERKNTLVAQLYVF